MQRFLFTIIMIGLLCAGCATTATEQKSATAPADGDRDREQIKQLCLNYAAGMNSRDADMILSLFTDDGSYITRIEGANRIVTKARYAELCPDKFKLWDSQGLKAKARVQTINVSGDKADGTMVMKYWGPGWNSSESYAVKFEKRQGKWVIVEIKDN
jgi:ketosteroid isomerase-like protein